MTYAMQLAPDGCTLTVARKAPPARVEVRGAPNYATDGYDPADPLHAFLDSLDPASVAVVMTYAPYLLNPANPRTLPSIAACVALFERT